MTLIKNLGRHMDRCQASTRREGSATRRMGGGYARRRGERRGVVGEGRRGWKKEDEGEEE
jgi:hypothetical protein